MKKILCALCVLFCLSTAHAQLSDVLSKAKSVASVAGFNVDQLTKGIMGKLTPSLSLTNSQTPKVTNVVSNFLTAKSKILSLAETNKAAYNQKQSSLFSNLKSKLAGILLQNQMNKFLGLKPVSNSPGNILSQLFF